MKRGFDTHRCDRMPEGFSLRRYDGTHLWPHSGGWVLGMRDYDWEWMTYRLYHVTPSRDEHVRFCPWCGEELEGEAE